MAHRLLGSPPQRHLLLLVVSLLTACGGESYQGVAFEHPAAAPELRLQTGSGAPFRLAEQTAPVTVVYFGYTHCPDVCPLTMGNLAAAVRKLPADQRADVRVVMVSVDPERDTPEIMQRYVAHFDESFVGLSGAPADVARVLQDWVIDVEREEADAAGSYFVSHPAGVNVVDGQHRMRLAFPSRMGPDEIAHDLLLLIKEQSGDRT